MSTALAGYSHALTGGAKDATKESYSELCNQSGGNELDDEESIRSYWCWTFSLRFRGGVRK